MKRTGQGKALHEILGGVYPPFDESHHVLKRKAGERVDGAKLSDFINQVIQSCG